MRNTTVSDYELAVFECYNMDGLPNIECSNTKGIISIHCKNKINSLISTHHCEESNSTTILDIVNEGDHRVAKIPPIILDELADNDGLSNFSIFFTEEKNDDLPISIQTNLNTNATNQLCEDDCSNNSSNPIIISSNILTFFGALLHLF